METMARTNPANVQNLVMLGGAYMQMQQTNRAMELFDTALARPELKFGDTAALAQYSRNWAITPNWKRPSKKWSASRPTSLSRATIWPPSSHHRQPNRVVAKLKIAFDASAKRLPRIQGPRSRGRRAHRQPAGPAPRPAGISKARSRPNEISNLRFSNLRFSGASCPLPGIRASAIFPA